MSFLKKTKLYLSSVILVALVVGLGFFVARHPGGQHPHFIADFHMPKRLHSRSPASIQKVFDFSYLKGDALEAAAKKRLLQSTFIAKGNHEAVIQMGNFVMLNDENEKDFACGYFDQVELTFHAEGVAVDGERPALSVVTGCQIGDNINDLQPIRIPVDKLTAQAPGNSEYKFFDSQPMSIQLTDPPPQWPSKWQLTDIKLTHSRNASRVLHVTPKDIQETGTIMMNW